MVFWPGITGEFMSYLPKTLIITLGSSLFVGLVINPVICALFMVVDGQSGKAKLSTSGKIIYSVLGVILGLIFTLVSGVISGIGAESVSPGTFISGFISGIIKLATVFGMLGLFAFILWGLNRIFLEPVGDWWRKKGIVKVIDKYETTISAAIKYWPVTIFGAFLVMASSIFLLKQFPVGVEFFPENIPHVMCTFRLRLRLVQMLISPKKSSMKSGPRSHKSSTIWTM